MMCFTKYAPILFRDFGSGTPADRFGIFILSETGAECALDRKKSFPAINVYTVTYGL
jgi:hypothetical protein